MQNWNLCFGQQFAMHCIQYFEDLVCNDVNIWNPCTHYTMRMGMIPNRTAVTYECILVCNVLATIILSKTVLAIAACIFSAITHGQFSHVYTDTDEYCLVRVWCHL